MKVVRLGHMLYLEGVTAEAAGDAGEQTRRVLQRIESLLAESGSDKSKLLTAEVRLASDADREAHDAAWGEWVDRAHPPLRIFQIRGSAAPVEIAVTATR
jgi:enamine deaminase RidA (YjgF/YER057c/UK114 family)